MFAAIARPLLVSMFALLCALPARASDPASCRTVSFSDVGWTDITVTTASARLLFTALGYETRVDRLSVPDTYKALGEGRLDVFLGNWMPSMEADLAPYREAGSVVTVGPNLEGAKYTLAVNRAAYEGGVRSFADLVRFKDRLDGKIHGIEPGNDGNALIQQMIDENAFGLGAFQLAESSENGMLGQVMSAERLVRWIVFLGWEPHPMNTRFEMRYLEGGDQYFGPDFGGAKVYSNLRKDFARDCPNAARLVGNLRFTLDMENRLMDEVLSGRKNRRKAARDWMVEHPQAVEQWLAGVRTLDGRPGLEAVREALAR